MRLESARCLCYKPAPPPIKVPRAALTVRISIITVTRNAAAYLEKCIQSVASQTYPACEYIIIDGASTDGTRAIVERHRAHIAQFVSEPDDGLYHAMNKGIARATGNYLLFLAPGLSRPLLKFARQASPVE